MKAIAQWCSMRARGQGWCLLALMLLAMMGSVAAGEPRSPSSKPISVVTLNLWHDKADWPKRQARIVLTLAKLQPDVIALQEVLQDRGLPNQAMTLARALGYDYRFASVDAPTAQRRYGNALLTRHRIVADDVIALRPLDDYRTLLHARVRIDGLDVDAYVTHLHFQPAGGAIRRQQVDDLLAHIDATSDARPVLIAGDFNIEADAPELAALSSRYTDSYGRCHPKAAANDAQHGTLNPAFHPAQRIDHVFLDPNHFAVLSAQRLFDQPYSDGDWASDHFGVEVSLRLVANTHTDATDCQHADSMAN